MRDYRCPPEKKGQKHMTGRICDTPGCNGALKDTIINFGENLRDSNLEFGYRECGKSDLVLCMGSSMRVTPACDMPFTCKPKGGKVVIINLQKTPCDNKAALVIHEKIEKVI